MRYRLPSHVNLPVAHVAPLATIVICLGSPSRQLQYLWRTQQGFPAAWREGREYFILTDAVADWLIAKGITVSRI